MALANRSSERNTRPTGRGFGAVRTAAALGLTAERLWPLVFGLGCVAALFLIAAWSGVFQYLPAMVRLAVLAVFALAAITIIWRNRHIRLPTAAEITARIEQASGLTHQPLRAQEEQAVGADPISQALWKAHQRRMAARLRDLTGGTPAMRSEKLDPYGLRALLALGVVTAFAYSYGPAGGRLADAFAPMEGTVLAAPRLDAWVTPPGYTGRAPLFLDAANEPVTVPAGSVLSIRVSDGDGVHFSFKPDDAEAEIIPALDENEDEAAASAQALPAGFELPLSRAGTAKVETRFRTLGSWQFVVIPDQVPVIDFEGEPQQARNGALEIGYSVEDDYGAPSGKALVEPLDVAAGARPLFPPPEINLVMPRRTKGVAHGRTSVNMVESPYAGARVRMTLTAVDDAGQTGQSEPLEMTLPQKPFNNPLARAVVEQRRILALDANAARRVVDLLDAVTLHGDSFIPRSTDYLALRAARERIANAADDDVLRSAVDFLWEVALGIEDGNLSFAERRLREAQENLAEALRNDASDEEIAELMQELREAMQEFLQSMAEAMRNQPPQNLNEMGNAQELRSQDLERMLDQIEDLARSGSRDAAEQLLSELQDMMNNLQMAQPNQQQGENPLQQQMNEMGELLQKQQELMDQTFELGRQQLRRQWQEGMEGMPQMPGEEQQGEMPTAEELQQQLEQLQQQQGALQERLEALQKSMEDLGFEPGDNMGKAGEAMGQAEGALGRGSDGEAVDRQGEALQALREGAQDMMRQMQEAMQGQPGQQGQQGQQQGMGQGFAPGEQRSGRDPLGRQRQTEGPDFGQNVDIPDEIDIQRAREILEQIRERLGNRLSPELERQYLERLLRTQ